MPPKGKQLKQVKEKKDCESSRKRGVNWSTEETNILIDVLRENNDDFRKAKRKNGIYEKIWKEISNLGVIRSLQQIKDRHKVLQNKFKAEKKEHSETGSSPSEWPFYEACAAFMGNIALNNHKSVDSLDQSSQKDAEESSDDDRMEPRPSPRRKKPEEPSADDTIESRPGTSNDTSTSFNSTQMTDEEEDSDFDKVPGNSEEDELQSILNPKKKKRVARPEKKAPKSSVVQVISDEMKANREASAKLQETLSNALSGFGPLMQNLGSTLQFLPQMLQQGHYYPPPTAPLQHHYQQPPGYGYGHQLAQGFQYPHGSNQNVQNQYFPPQNNVPQNNNYVYNENQNQPQPGNQHYQGPTGPPPGPLIPQQNDYPSQFNAQDGNNGPNGNHSNVFEPL